jgi:NTP pyrophosphatase (non-canonical NTP hydrolase)
MDYRDLELKVIYWAEARKIIPNGTIAGQAGKTAEEASELVEAAAALTFIDGMLLTVSPELRSELAVQREKVMTKYRDAVGDIVVTLINGCALADVDLVKCLAEAYDEIKDRKGTLLPNGVFVKDVA